MKINWTIKKKRGNFRPSLNFTITLEDYEKKLAINAVGVETPLPLIPDTHQSFCLPNENERHPQWTPKKFHYIQVPYFKKGESREFIRLPFRSSGEYPEVAAAFKKLRAVYEAEVCQAYGLAPFEQPGRLGVSSHTRKRIAPRVMADRLLDLFGTG